MKIARPHRACPRPRAVGRARRRARPRRAQLGFPSHGPGGDRGRPGGRTGHLPVARGDLPRRRRRSLPVHRARWSLRTWCSPPPTAWRTPARVPATSPRGTSWSPARSTGRSRAGRCWASPTRSCTPPSTASDAAGDAALLVLSNPTTSPAIQLASPATDASFLAPGHHALMAGWGETFPADRSPTNSTGPARRSSRHATARAHTRVYVPSEELCTLDVPARQAVACFGDSGGPLLGALASTGEVVELGVASHLYTDCQPTSPVVYTRADLVSTWVHDWIDSASYLPGTVTPASAAHTVAGVAPTAAGHARRLQRPHRRRRGGHVARRRQRRMDHRSSGHGDALLPSAGRPSPVALSWPAEALFISGGAATATLPISP